MLKTLTEDDSKFIEDYFIDRFKGKHCWNTTLPNFFYFFANTKRINQLGNGIFCANNRKETYVFEDYELANKIKDYCTPKSITVLYANHKTNSVNDEYIYNIKSISELKIKTIRNSFVNFNKNYKVTRIPYHQLQHVDECLNLFKEWESQQPWTMFGHGIISEELILRNDSDFPMLSWVYFVNEKIVGYSFYCVNPCNGEINSLIRKGKKEFKGINEYILVEDCRELLSKGYHFINDAGCPMMNNTLKKFKTKLIKEGGMIYKGYYERIYTQKVPKVEDWI
jgi:hypothetical protein